MLEILFIVGALTIGYIITYFIKSLLSNLTRKHLFENKKTIYDIDVKPFRDLPFKDDYQMSYLVAYEYDLINKSSYFLGAMILSMLLNDNIKLLDNGETISLVKRPENEVEAYLFDHLKSHSILDEVNIKKYTNYLEKNYDETISLFNELLRKIFNNKKQNRDYFSCKYYYCATDLLNEKAVQLAGLQKFIKEFTLLNEKEKLEVKIWESYLIHAQLLGYGEKYIKYFFKNYLNNDNYISFDIFNHFNHVGTGAIFRKNLENSKEDSYFSGGGGFSSGGGGGGSFGGGGGGGGFR